MLFRSHTVWTEDELQIMRQCAHLSSRHVSTLLGRTPSAIAKKREYMGISVKQYIRSGGYESINAVAMSLGLSGDKLARWIKQYKFATVQVGKGTRFIRLCEFPDWILSNRAICEKLPTGAVMKLKAWQKQIKREAA